MLKEDNSPRYLIILCMLYILSICMGFLFIEKELTIPFFGIASAGVLILPFSFSFLDLIAEVYGYKYSKITVFSGLFAQGFFCLISYVLSCLPSSHIGVTNTEQFAAPEAYHEIIRILPRVFFASAFSTTLGLLINTYLLSKWKVMFKGRYFGFRSLASSSIGEFIFTAIGVSIICIGRFPLMEMSHFILISFLAKIVITTLLTYPIAVVASILKDIEPFKFDQESIFLNPFKNT